MWNEVKSIDSSDKNVKKYVFEKENAVAEAVLYKYNSYKERTVICCSTQSGCPVGCRFCGAGDNFVRSLTAFEIVSQVVQLVMEIYREERITPDKMDRFQIMFMSMGEPMLNQRALLIAIEWLHMLWPNASLLVSTSAPKVNFEAFYDLAEKIPTVGLQFSVHESTDEARNILIPFKAKMSLAEIAEAGEEFYNRTGRTPFFNYCAHSKNTSEDDARRLFDLFDPQIWQATISVICERDESIAAANERQRQLATDFEHKLQQYNFRTRVFNPAGQDDIGGGCGQLWFVQDWMAKNPQHTKCSAGRGLQKVHAPH